VISGGRPRRASSFYTGISNPKLIYTYVRISTTGCENRMAGHVQEEPTRHLGTPKPYSGLGQSRGYQDPERRNREGRALTGRNGGAVSPWRSSGKTERRTPSCGGGIAARGAAQRERKMKVKRVSGRRREWCLVITVGGAANHEGWWWWRGGSTVGLVIGRRLAAGRGETGWRAGEGKTAAGVSISRPQGRRVGDGTGRPQGSCWDDHVMSLSR
jgi:hypothetical protein